MQTSYTCVVNRQQEVTVFKKNDKIMMGMIPLSPRQEPPLIGMSTFSFGVQVSIIKS